MTDIIERLHIPVVIPRGSITCVITDQLRVDIIAAIDRLRAERAERDATRIENERLRKALAATSILCDEIEQLRTQRAELLAALKLASRTLQRKPLVGFKTSEVIRAAIAKAEGRT